MRLIKVAALLVVLFCAAHARADDTVTIEKQPPVVETRYFNVKKHPADMPQLTPGEAAVTVSLFSCESHVNVEVLKETPGAGAGDCTATVKVQNVKLTLKLSITIWLPEHAPDKMRAHEEGHRRLAERFYATVDPQAHDLAAAIVGNVADGTAPDCDAAADAAIRNAANNLAQRYLQQTTTPHGAVQDEFDALTDHGRNKLPEDEAMRRAWEKFGPTTKPVGGR